MTKSNQSWMQKADIAIGDLEANGGLLNPEQSKTFIQTLITQPTILSDARVVGMGAPIRNINRIGFGSRIMRKAVPSTALSQSDRAKPDLGQITLTAQEVIAQVDLPYNVLEDNIESATTADNGASNTGPGGLRNTIIQLIAKAAARDLEELSLKGDTSSGDDYLALVNGWLKVGDTDGHVVDFENASISKRLFKRGKKAMPDVYLSGVSSMKHYVSADQETEYRDRTADRATGYGDNVLQGTDSLRAFGSAITPCYQMPEDKGLFVNPQNLLFGIWRNISMEFDKDIKARVYNIVLTARVAVQVETADAMVEYQNIGDDDADE